LWRSGAKRVRADLFTRKEIAGGNLVRNNVGVYLASGGEKKEVKSKKSTTNTGEGKTKTET